MAASAYAQTGRVVGIVKDETGQPIKGATLSLENPEASPSNFTATSDDRGRFAVIGLKAGEWSIVAQAPGFQAEVARLQVRATTPSAPALTMKRAPQAPASALGSVGAQGPAGRTAIGRSAVQRAAVGSGDRLVQVDPRQGPDPERRQPADRRGVSQQEGLRQRDRRVQRSAEGRSEQRQGPSRRRARPTWRRATSPPPRTP